MLGDVIQQVPHEPVEFDVLPGFDGEHSELVGRYWMRGEPKPLSEHIACADYSVRAVTVGNRVRIALTESRFS